MTKEEIIKKYSKDFFDNQGTLMKEDCELLVSEIVESMMELVRKDLESLSSEREGNDENMEICPHCGESDYKDWNGLYNRCNLCDSKF